LKPSVLYHTNNFRFGASLRFPMTFHIDQDNYEEYYSANDGSYFQIHQRIDQYIEDNYSDYSDYYGKSYKIKAPMQLGLGVSFGQPGERCIALDMVYENWSKAEFEGENDPYYFTDKYRSSLAWRVGAEHYLPFLDAIGRIGYLRQPVNFKGPREDYEGAPEIDVKNEQDYLTLGFSKQFDESFRLDIGYAHGFWRVTEGYRQDKETHGRVYATMTYRMPVVF